MIVKGSKRLIYNIRSIRLCSFLLLCVPMYEGACPHMYVEDSGLHQMSSLVVFCFFFLKTESLTQPGAPCFS